MDKIAKEYIIDFFSKKLSLFGNAPSAVGWSAAGQRQRYECILKLLPLEGHSILDFGCGKGDFYGFLKEKNISVTYTGSDINPKLIRAASSNFPDAEFLTLDIDSEDIPGVFDYTILCGVFNLNIQGVRESISDYLNKLFHHTKDALLFNCLSLHTKKKDTNLVYLEPSELLSQTLQISKFVNLYHNLIEGDIFLIMGKDSIFRQPHRYNS